MATRLNMTAPSGCVSVCTRLCACVCVMTAAQSLVVCVLTQARPAGGPWAVSSLPVWSRFSFVTRGVGEGRLCGLSQMTSVV